MNNPGYRPVVKSKRHWLPIFVPNEQAEAES